MPTVAELRARVIYDDRELQSGVRSSDTALRRVGTAAQATTRDLERLASTGHRLRDMGQVLTLGVSVPLALVGKRAFDSAVAFDSLNRGLTAVMGSAQAATRETAQLAEVAKLPGLGMREALQGSINLQAAGFSADEARKHMVNFGNALATVGKGKYELDLVQRQLIQLSNRTSGFGEDIRALQSHLPQITQSLKAAFGTANTEEIGKMGVTGREVVDILSREFGKLPKMTGGIRNDIENASDAIDRSLMRIGNAVIPTVAKVIGEVVPIIDNATDAFSKLPKPVQEFTVRGLAVAAVAGPIVFAFGQMLDSVTKIRTGWQTLRDLLPSIVRFFLVQKAESTSLTIQTGIATAARDNFTRAVVRNNAALAASNAIVPVNSRAMAANAGAAGAAGAAGQAAGAGGFLGSRLTMAGGLLAAGTVAVIGYQLGKAAGEQLGKALESAINRGRQTRENLEVSQRNLDVQRRRDTPLFERPQVRELINRMMKEGRMTEQQAQQEFLRSRARNEAEQARAMQPAQSGQVRTPQLKGTPEELAKASEAAFRARLEFARSRVELSPEERRSQDEARTLIPILQARQRELTAEAQRLLPEARKTAEGREAFFKVQQDYADLQGQINRLQMDASKEITENAKKKADEAKRTVEEFKRNRDEQFRIQRDMALDSVSDSQEGERARDEAAALVPVLKRQIMSFAQTGDFREVWKTRTEINRLLHRAAIEEDREIKRHEKERNELMEEVGRARMSALNVLLDRFPEEQRAAQAVNIIVPELKRNQQQILSLMREQTPDMREYWQNATAVYDVERQIREFERNAIERRQEEVKKAKDEQRQVAELEFQLREEQLRGIPGLTESQQKLALIPLMQKRLAELRKPVEGETRIQAINREIDAQRLQNQIIEAAGLRQDEQSLRERERASRNVLSQTRERRPGFARVIGGGLIPLRRNTVPVSQVPDLSQILGLDTQQRELAERSYVRNERIAFRQGFSRFEAQRQRVLAQQRAMREQQTLTPPPPVPAQEPAPVQVPQFAQPRPQVPQLSSRVQPIPQFQHIQVPSHPINQFPTPVVQVNAPPRQPPQIPRAMPELAGLDAFLQTPRQSTGSFTFNLHPMNRQEFEQLWRQMQQKVVRQLYPGG